MQPENNSKVMWIEFEGATELEILASRLDIWHVQNDSGIVVALVTPNDLNWLESAGYSAVTHPASIQDSDTIPGYTCYHTIDEQYAILDTLSQQYPQLSQINVIGYSYEGRELRILQLTNAFTSGPKPAFFLMANIHGRELITNETALEFSRFLLESYSVDPDITWLLDEHIIYVLVSGNPDGHVKNEPGEPWTWWRKNTQPYGSCSEYSYGVDLNRNASFMWGNASPDPCNIVYQGPVSASEPETVAIASFIQSLFPDRKGSGIDDPAPADTSGIFITLHSYGNYVLWPWAYTSSVAPNVEQFEMLGGKLASFNGYIAQSGSDLYPASGTTFDYAYGELGVPSFLIEMGSAADGFYPDCSRYDAIIQPNIGALLYAAKIARRPYETSFGPDIHNLTLTPSSATVGASVEISATVNDTLNGTQVISSAEFTVDTPPWKAGVTTVVSATDTLFDSPVESVSGVLDTDSLEPGRHLVFLRGMDNTGYWGPVSAAFLNVMSPGFELEPRQIYGYSSPGQKMTYTISMTNTSSINQTYWITGSESLWDTNFTPPQLTLAPMLRSSLFISVTVPTLDTLPNQQYEDQFTLTVTTATSPTLSHSAHITTRVLRFSSYLPLMIRVTD